MSSNPSHDAERDARIAATLRRWFGFDALRSMQKEAIDAALDGRDALVVLPTGGGKSLCYQLPALVMDRLVVVVSPLIALMQDQVDGLRLQGVPAAAVHSNLSGDARQELRQLAADGSLRLLFVAPERLFQESFLSWIAGQQVAAFAIDEAHCISQWGHDFRPEYRRLAELRQRFPGVPFQAFTATATPRVREDIVAQLALRDPVLLVGTFDRPELTYRVLPRQDLVEQVAGAIARHPDAASIVYCISRKETEQLAASLRKKGIAAEPYHAGLPSEQRTRLSADFRAERLDVIVATVAFGMGIDRSDVRLVVHAGMPKSLEAYQQETGRAGRDGLPAECLLLYSGADAAKWRSLMTRSAEEGLGDSEALEAQLHLLQQMQRYAGRARCRHKALSEYFGQRYEEPSCGACDVCLDELEQVPDGHVLAQKILSAVARTGQRYGASYVIDVLRGSRNEKVLQRGHDQLPTFGLCKDVPAARLGNYVDQLIDDGLLVRSDGEYPTLALGPASMAVLKSEQQAVLLVPKQALAARGRRRREGARGEAARDLDAAEQRLFESLRRLRREIASGLGVPPYVVFTDATLEALARERPTTESQMLAVHGIGQRKVASFGERFLAAIAAGCRDLGLAPPTAQSATRMEPQPPDADDADDDGRTGSRGRGAVAAARRERAAELFAAGTAIEVVGRELGLAPTTAAQYLERWILENRPDSIAPWVPAAIEARVREALAESGDGRLKPVFEALGGEVAYEVLRIVAAHARSGGEAALG